MPQRLPSPSSAWKIGLSSGVVIFFQFTLFLLIGVGLFVFYGMHPQVFGSSDRIFPTFIVQQMPHGVAGLLVAAILAAAMSNLSAALNSLSSTTVVDFYMPLRPSAGIVYRLGVRAWGGVGVLGEDHLLGVERACADVAIDDTERPERARDEGNGREQGVEPAHEVGPSGAPVARRSRLDRRRQHGLEPLPQHLEIDARLAFHAEAAGDGPEVLRYAPAAARRGRSDRGAPHRLRPRGRRGDQFRELSDQTGTRKTEIRVGLARTDDGV